MARNSASVSSQITAELQKQSTRKSAEYTGLRAVMSPSAEATSRVAKIRNRIWTSMFEPRAPSAVRRIRPFVGGDHGLVALPDREQLVLAHDVLAPMLHVVLVDAGEHDGIHRTGLFAEAAVDALEEVDVVACGAPRAILRHIRIDRDADGRADGLAELAGDAALLTVGIPAQRMQAAEARRLRSLLFRVVERVLAHEESARSDRQPLDELRHEKCLQRVGHRTCLLQRYQGCAHGPM